MEQIDLAVATLSSIGERLGCGPIERSTGRGELVEDAERALGPLRLPADLRHFWTEWDPADFEVVQQIVDVQFFGPTESISNIEFHLELGWPRILLQLSDAQYSTMTIELSTPTVDGGRVFELNSHGPGHLVGRGVADLLTLFATVADLHGSSEEDIYFETMDRRARELGSVAVPEDRGSWSRSWLEAEGYDEAWLQPKGPTHTIAAFETERRDHWPLGATIQGSLRVTGGVGGSIHGTLSDDSGSIDLVLADRIPSAGLGPDRRIEVEVETTGPPDDELPGADPTIRVVAVRPLNPERD